MNNEELYEKIDQYLLGELNEQEKFEFEELLRKDDQLNQEVVVQKSLFETIGEQSFNGKAEIDETIRQKVIDFNNSPSGKQIASGILKAQNEYKKPKVIKFDKRILLSIAASIIVIIAYTFNMDNVNNENLYDTYKDWGNLPSLVERGGDDSIMTEAEIAFDLKDYEKAVTLFEKSVELNPSHSQILIYLGISQMEINAYEDAIETFNLLKNSNTLDSHKASWYTALVYLKSGKLEKAKIILNKMIVDENTFKHKETISILEKLD